MEIDLILPKKLWANIYNLSEAAQPTHQSNERVISLSPGQALELAKKFSRQKLYVEAESILSELILDPDPDISREAQFLIAQNLEERGEFRQALGYFDKILAERPDAIPVRLERARALLAIGKRKAAYREYEKLTNTNLPEPVRKESSEALLFLRSSRPWGGSIEIGLSPDSNFNQGPNGTVVTVGGLPFSVDENTRARSSVGFNLGGRGYYRIISQKSKKSILIDGGVNGLIYRDSHYNDIIFDASIGLELKNEWTPMLTASRRWYGGKKYLWSYGIGINKKIFIRDRKQLLFQFRANQLKHDRFSDRNGIGFSANFAYQWLTKKGIFLGFGSGISRQKAQAAFYANRIFYTYGTIGLDKKLFSTYFRLGGSLFQGDGKIF